MQMQMIDSLACVRIDVENGAIPLFVDIKLLSKLSGNLEQMCEERLILHLYIVKGGNVPSGYDQKVHWGLRVYVFECHYEVVAIHRL